MISQIMAPGGGLSLIPFTRGVIICLWIITTTVYIMGMARLHMAILSFLSAGMYFSLGYLQRAYENTIRINDSSSSNGSSNCTRQKYSIPPSKAFAKKNMSKSKRED